MGKIFDLDSPLIRFLNKVADLMWLNILVLICSIPVFTAGAALTAAHYVALKMRRDEEGYITREFFKSFKANFKQATLIWLLMLVIAAVLGTDFYLMRNNEDLKIPQVLQVLIMAASVLYVFLLVWVFPVQAKFVNPISRTIKNAFALSMIQLPKTILMILAYALPWGLLWLTLRVFPLVFLFGLSAPIFISAFLYNKMFKGLEEKIRERMAEETPEGEKEPEEDDGVEQIFSDTPVNSGGEQEEKH